VSREDEIFIQRTEELNSLQNESSIYCQSSGMDLLPSYLFRISQSLYRNRVKKEVKCFDITTTGYFRIWYSSFIHCSINIIERVDLILFFVHHEVGKIEISNVY